MSTIHMQQAPLLSWHQTSLSLKNMFANLYRPLSTEYLMNVLPNTTKNTYIIDKINENAGKETTQRWYSCSTRWKHRCLVHLWQIKNKIQFYVSHLANASIWYKKCCGIQWNINKNRNILFWYYSFNILNNNLWLLSSA